MRIYNFKAVKVPEKSIVGYGKIFFGTMYRVYDSKGKKVMTLEFDYEPSKNKLKRTISKNLYRPTLPF